MGSGKKGPVVAYYDAHRVVPYKVGQWLPKFAGAVDLVMSRRIYHCLWRRSTGLYAHSSTPRGCPGSSPTYYPELPSVPRMKRREKADGSTIQLPSAAPMSTLLGKLPVIREWCSATAYEDGTLREPGAIRITTRGVLWQITITDPDSDARIVVVNPDLDTALKLVETYLSAPDAPWEVDQFARERRSKKPKK